MAYIIFPILLFYFSTVLFKSFAAEKLLLAKNFGQAQSLFIQLIPFASAKKWRESKDEVYKTVFKIELYSVLISFLACTAILTSLYKEEISRENIGYVVVSFIIFLLFYFVVSLKLVEENIFQSKVQNFTSATVFFSITINLIIGISKFIDDEFRIYFFKNLGTLDPIVSTVSLLAFIFILQRSSAEIFHTNINFEIAVIVGLFSSFPEIFLTVIFFVVQYLVFYFIKRLYLNSEVKIDFPLLLITSFFITIILTTTFFRNLY